MLNHLFDKPQWVGSFTASTYDAGLESELDKGSFLLPSREAVLYHIYQVVELQKSEQTLLSVQSDRVPRYIQILQELLDHDNVLSSQVGDMGKEERERSHRLRRLLLKLSKETGILPTVLFLTDVVPESTENRADWGGYADIYKATLDGQSVALKRLRNFSRDRNRGQARDRPGGSGYFTSSMQAFCREAIVWRQLKHRHILPFLGVDRFAFPSRLCMVSPWMPYGNINQCMSELIADDCHIPRDRWVREIIDGLRYLHSEDVIHGDLRGANIFVDAQGGIKLSDFGLTTFTDTTTLSWRTFSGGAARWTAPEILQDSRPTWASDMYAFGCVFLEIYTNQRPFAELIKDFQVIAAVLSGSRPQLPYPTTDFQRGLFKLVQYCWDSEPTQRPTTDFVAMNLDPIANEALDYDFIFHSASRYPAEHDHDRPEKKAAHFHRPTPAYVSDTGFGTGDSTACSPGSPTSFSPFLRQRVGRSPTYDRSNEEAQLPVHETFPASFSPWSHVSSASGSPFSIVSANTSPFSVISPNSGPFIPYHPSQQCPR